MKTIIPRSSILQNEKEYYIYAELPGVTKTNLTVNVDDDVLTITGVPTYNVKDDLKLIHREFNEKANFERRFILGNKIDKNKIDAKLNNGILKVVLAKSPESAGKKIEVK